MGAVPEPLPVDPPREPGTGSAARSAAALAVVYIAAGCVGLFALWPASGPSVFWPAAGVALGWLVRFGARAWPGVFVGGVVINSIAGGVPVLAAVVAVGNAAAAVSGAWVVRRIAGPGFSLGTLRGVSAVLGGAVFGALPVSVVGPLVLWWEGFTTSGGLGLSGFVISIAKYAL